MEKNNQRETAEDKIKRLKNKYKQHHNYVEACKEVIRFPKKLKQIKICIHDGIITNDLNYIHNTLIDYSSDFLEKKEYVICSKYFYGLDYHIEMAKDDTIIITKNIRIKQTLNDLTNFTRTIKDLNKGWY